MAVAFSNMPADLRVPLFYAEFNAGSPPYSGESRLVLIGHKLAAGTAPVGELANLGSIDPITLFGAGSMLADMAIAARRHDPTGEIFCLPIAEPGGSTKSVWTLTFAGTATSGGTIARYIAGERVSIAVAVGDTASVIASRFAAAVTAGYTKFNIVNAFPVVATVAAGVVTLTAQHGGTSGNGIRIEEGLDGPEAAVPAGVTVTLANPTAGAGDVDMAAALALLGSARAEYIAAPFVTVTQLNAVRDFLADTGTGRWAPTVQLYGHYITAMNGNLGALTAFGAARNDAHVTIFGSLNTPNAPWVVAASAGGIVSRSKNLGASITEAIEIALPLQTIVLEGVRPAKALTDRFQIADRNSLYRNGIAAFHVRSDGQVAIDRAVTTYQRNPWGAPDITFLDLETLAISAYIGRYLRQRIETTYPRHVLKDENPGNLQGVATPGGIRATIMHVYRELFDGGLVEKPDLFNRNLIVERSADPNRVNAYLPVDVANQLRVFAANVTIFTEARAA